MDRIHEKATKIICDIKNKPECSGVSHHNCNNEQSKKQITPKSCCYCHKVFVNSSYLLKHVLRRHSDDFLAVHRKCLKQESNNNIFDTKYIIEYIQAEFNLLRKEITEIEGIRKSKEKCLNSNNHNEEISTLSVMQQNNNTNCENVNADIIVNSRIKSRDVNMNQQNSETSQGKIAIDIAKDSSDVKKEIQYLNSEFNKLKSVVENESFLKDMYNLVTANENKMLQVQDERLHEFKDIIEKDFYFALSKQLNEANSNWQNQFSELKQKVESLAFVINVIGEKIKTSDYIKLTAKTLERNNIKFSERSIQDEHSFKTTDIFERDPNYTKTSGDNIESNSLLSFQNIRNETGSEGNSKFISSQHLPSGIGIKSKNKNSNITLCSEESNVSNINSDEVSSIVNAKMGLLGIPPCASKIPSKDFLEKMKQLEDSKNLLSLNYQNFLKIFKKINLYAEQLTKSKLKKERKIRFSEPFTGYKNGRETDKKSKKSNQTYPIAEHNMQSFKPVILSKSFNEPSFESHIEISKLQETIQQSKQAEDIANKSFNSIQDTAGCSSHLQISCDRRYEQMHSTPLKEEICRSIIGGDTNICMPVNVQEHYLQTNVNADNKNEIKNPDLHDCMEKFIYGELEPQRENFPATNINMKSNTFSPPTKVDIHDGKLTYKKVNQSNDKICENTSASFWKNETEKNLSDASSLESLSSWDEDKDNSSIEHL